MKSIKMHNKDFWDFEAKNYPRPFDKEVLEKTGRLIERMKFYGVNFDDAEIIDIGCGTGIHSLNFARNARKVVCFDVSKSMIEILKDEANKFNIKNIETIVGDFREYNFDNYKKSFDIAFASTTPAIREKEDLLKMENLSRKWCIFIGFAKMRENNVYDDVFEHFKIKRAFNNSYETIKNFLDERKTKYDSFVFEDKRTQKRDIDDATDMFYHLFLHYQAEIEKEKIKEYLLSKYGDYVEIETKTTKGMLIWRVDMQ